MAQTLTKRPKKHTAAAAPDAPSVRDATPEEEWQALDWQTQRYLGISGTEFLRRWSVQTAGYLYRVDSVAVEQPAVAYHWHP